MKFTTIHTLNARDNVMLDVAKECFALSDAATHRAIQDVVRETAAVLLSKGVTYSELRAALVPQTDKNEIVLFFDREGIGNVAYGHAVHAEILPLLRDAGSHSVQHGDLLGEAKDQVWIASQFNKNLVTSENPFVWRESRQMYGVHINNVTIAAVARFHEALSAYGPYVGYANVTFASPFKTYLSMILATAYIAHGGCVVQSHEDDLSDGVDQNTLGYDFASAGYRCISIRGFRFNLLLSYKIERPVLPGFESDVLLSLTAISEAPRQLHSITVEVEQAKLEYLAREKSGTLKRLGVYGAPKATLEDLVTAKLESNYIYSLGLSECGGVAKFNMVLELEDAGRGVPVRVLGAFEYKASEASIRLITMY